MGLSSALGQSLACLAPGYYVVMLLPVLGFVNIGFMGYSLVADHWQYFAILAPIALASALFSSTFRARSPRFDGSASGFSDALSPAGLLLAFALLLALGGLTWRQSALYANAETLWQGTLAADPGCWAAHNNFGSSLLEKGAVEEAIAHFQAALRMRPDYAEAHYNLGLAVFQKGRADEAIAHFQAALQIKPNFAAAHEGCVPEAITVWDWNVPSPLPSRIETDPLAPQ